jgi:hypothetical protein
MSTDPTLRYSYEEREALFAALFPRGFAGDDVLAELAPSGWESASLKAVFHPSAEQVYEESKRVHENMRELFVARRAKAADEREEPAPPDFEEIRAEHASVPVDPQRECRELVGMCLWDIFSDNHEVIGPDGRIVDLGSFRASAGFLAEQVNRQLGHDPGLAEAREIERLKRMIGVTSMEAILEMAQADAEEKAASQIYDYMNFYMGTQMVSGRADLAPVYGLIFRRLKSAGCDWTYHFPRLNLVDLRPLRDQLEEEKSDFTDYDPSAAFAKQHERQEHDEEVGKMREQLDDAYRESVELAQHGPPPKTVEVYRRVFGHLPDDWPPEAS